MKKTEDAVRTLFDRISPRYDFFNTASTFFLDRHWRRSASRLVRKRDARVLDLCTGTAELALQFTRRVNGSGRVIGVDFSREMIGAARQKLKRFGKEKEVSLLIGNAAALSFRDGAFDYVTSAFSMRNLVDLDGALREMYRVLKPGGEAIILEINRPAHRISGMLYRFYLCGLIPLIGVLTVGRVYPFLYLKDSVLTFDTPETFTGRLRAAGFRDVFFRVFWPGAIGLYHALKAGE